jgi:hypothetical protein
MSKAYKCDACEVCFDPMSMKNNETMITFCEYWEQNTEDILEHRHRPGKWFMHVHLCPTCTRVFNMLMQGKPLVEKQLLDTLQEDFDAQMKEETDDETPPNQDKYLENFNRLADAVYRAYNVFSDSLRRIFAGVPTARDGETPERKGDTE